MKPMSKKKQMVCIIPAVLAASAVMIYCIAANMPLDEKPLLYALAVGIAVFLVMDLLVGRRINAREGEKANGPAASSAPAKASAAPSAADGRIDLRKELTSEEIRILLSDLQTAGDRVPSDQKAALSALAGEISRTGTIHAKALPVCVAAVENGLGVFSAFGLAPAGHTELLNKLKKLEE